jgi:hypothetical protein
MRTIYWPQYLPEYGPSWLTNAIEEHIELYARGECDVECRVREGSAYMMVVIDRMVMAQAMQEALNEFYRDTGVHVPEGAGAVLDGAVPHALAEVDAD